MSFSFFCVFIGKESQDATSKTYRFIPMQNFSSDSDINWNCTIEEIDEQLFEMYKLENEEIKHIMENMKNMNLSYFFPKRIYRLLQ